MGQTDSKSYQLRVRVTAEERDHLEKLRRERGRGETISDLVREAISLLVDPSAGTEALPAKTQAQIERLAVLLKREPRQVEEACVEGILDLIELKCEVPLIVMETRLRRRSTAPPPPERRRSLKKSASPRQAAFFFCKQRRAHRRTAPFSPAGTKDGDRPAREKDRTKPPVRLSAEAPSRCESRRSFRLAARPTASRRKGETRETRAPWARDARRATLRHPR
jgi:hypothetical protein